MNASEQTCPPAPSIPPIVGCPTWCCGGHVPWEPDGNEFAVDHHSEQLASPGAKYSLTLYSVDAFYDGTWEIRQAAPILRLHDECLDFEDSLLLAADLDRANAMAADTRRHVR